MLRIFVVVLALFFLEIPLFATSSDCLPMKKLEKHMPMWVGEVPYSHLVNKTWGYPTDCSGFVSWALKVENDLKAYEYASDTFSQAIKTDDLRYGDIITYVFGDDSCTKDGNTKTKVDAGDEKAEKEGDDVDLMAYPSPPEISGHVFFFDRWDDSNHDNFWAYESTDAQDQTEECLAQTGLMIRSLCFNHHVLKSRKTPEKYSKESCVSKTYGVITGGPKRLSPKLLCQD